MTGLSFFHPQYLWGLLFLAVPVIIHFIRARRIVKLEFSTTHFLRDAAVKASKLRRFRQLLLLLVRVCFLAVLVCAFAHLFSRKNPFSILTGSSCSVYCWIDPTISMGYGGSGESLWQQACRFVSFLDTTLPARASVAVYSNTADAFITILRHEGRIIEDIATGMRNGPTDAEAMVRKFLERKAEESGPAVLVLFTDFQKKDKPYFESVVFMQSLSRVPLLFVSMGEDDSWNYSVAGASISSEGGLALTCTVKAFRRDVQDRELVAAVETMRIGQKTIRVKRNDSVRVSLDLGNQLRRSKGELKLVADDPLVCDNVTYFVDNKALNRKALILTDDAKRSAPVALALKTVSGVIGGNPAVMPSNTVSYDALDSADIILLCEMKAPAEAVYSLWNRNAFTRKIIIFSPALDDRAGGLNNAVCSYLDKRSRVKKTRAENPCFPILPDTMSSLWKGFPRTSDKGVAVYEYLMNIPGTTLLGMNTAAPLVTGCLDSNNNVWILFATPIGITEANNLCESGFYIPLLDRVIRYASAKVFKNSAAWYAGYAMPNPFYGKRTGGRVFTADNTLVQVWENQQRVTLETPGLYAVHPQQEVAYWIAVTLDPSESDVVYQKPVFASTVDKSYARIIDKNSFKHFITGTGSFPRLELFWIVLGLLLIAEVLLWKREYGKGA